MDTRTDTVTITLPRDVAERIAERLENDPWRMGQSVSDLLAVLIGEALGSPYVDSMREKVRQAWGV